MPSPITSLQRLFSVVRKDGTMEERLNAWQEEITRQVNNLQTINGTGSPEGVEVASVGRYFWDQTASALYYKESGDGNTGWKPV